MDEKELSQNELNNEKTAIKDSADGWHRDICQGIMMAYFIVMAGIYPFYVPGGYMRIGEIKFQFFRNVSLVTLGVVAVVIFLSAAIRRDREWVVRNYRRMSVTDWFAYGYFVTVMLSYLCSPYKGNALWGVEGWRVGVVTQMIFILIYFLFSRYFNCNLGWIGLWLLAAAAVFLLGICNRYSLYPIAMEGQTETFISTLGNINWFCGYWSVTAPVGIMLYWCCDRMWVRIAAGIYSVIAMLSGVTQGSESAYLVFAAVLFMLLILSVYNRMRLYRFLELLMMFAGSCLLAKWMMHIPGLTWNYIMSEADTSLGAAAALLYGNAAVWLFLITFVCCIILRMAEHCSLLHTEDRMKKRSPFNGMVIAAIVVTVYAAALLFLKGSGALYTREPSDTVGGDRYKIVFEESWGHGRGAAWNCGINAYYSMSALHKIVGIGPDCFADYVYEVPELADRLANQFANQRLTNAHNEQITMLVNTGALGLLCYVGFFLTAFVRCVRRAGKQPMLYLCAAGILGYAIHNLVSFQQVLNAPFVFITLGIGEKLCREPQMKGTHGSACSVTEDMEGDRTNSANLETAEQIAQYLIAAVSVVLCIAVAFYTENGYYQIGNAKFAAYRNVMLVGCAAMFVVVIPYIFFVLKEHRKLKISVTDGCVLVYLVLVGVSVISGGFYQDALWGYDGWNMGLMSQLGFVLLYLLVSRFGKYYRPIIASLLAAACVVYGIGILHRLLIDPIGFYNGLTGLQKAQFLSTLGQTTWYGSFLAVTLPVGMGVFLFADRKAWRVLGGIFTVTGFCTLVTQNSDSAYFAVAGAFLVFLTVSARERKLMCRFMGSLTLFFASGKIMYFLMQINPNPQFEPDFITQLMWTSALTWVLLAICFLAAVVLYIIGMKAGAGEYPEIFIRRVRRGALSATVVTVAGVILIIILQSRGVMPNSIADKLASISYFNWNDGWGNGRGRIWSFSVKMFFEESIVHKLFGVGPDCFHSYVAARYSEEAALLWGTKQLTNAHNEWLNSLINAGIIGTAAYIGIYVTAIRRFLRGQQQNTLLIGIAAACVSYMCYNFFCYQQVLCTPFIFLLIGIGEYIDKTQPSV